MKRSFIEIDDVISSNILQQDQKFTNKLNRLRKLEETVDMKLSSYQRQLFPMNIEPTIRTKYLRTFIRHEYFPFIDKEKSYYLVYIDGHILDDSIMNDTSNPIRFGSFWEKIRLQVDRKQGPQIMFEWSVSDNCHEGVMIDCFKFRVNSSNTSLNLKLTFHRSSDIQSRYELDPVLKSILPRMRVDPTEEDVMLAIWEYVRSKDLMDKRFIKCNDVSLSHRLILF